MLCLTTEKSYRIFEYKNLDLSIKKKRNKYI